MQIEICGLFLQISNRNPLVWVVCAGALLMNSGCVQTKTSEPKRTAVEQLLLSRAADLAFANVDLTALKTRRVYFQEKYFESEDKAYVLGTIRNEISKAGGLLVDKPEDSQIIIEARSGALSIDSANSLIGIPEMPVPIPLAGNFVTPEVPFYKAEKQYSTAKIALFAYDTETRDHIASSGSLVGQSHNHFYRILGFIRWTSTDLPEKQL